MSTQHTSPSSGLMADEPLTNRELSARLRDDTEMLARVAREETRGFDALAFGHAIVAVQTPPAPGYNDRANAAMDWRVTPNGELCLGCDTPLMGDETRLCPQCNWDGPIGIQGPTLQRVRRPAILGEDLS